MKENAKKILGNLFLLTALSITAACAKQSADQMADGDNDAIIGGQLVDASETMAHSTVQLFGIEAGLMLKGSLFIAFRFAPALWWQKCGFDRRPLHSIRSTPYFYLFSQQLPKDIGALFRTHDPLLRQVSGGMTNSKWPLLKKNQETNWGDIALLRFDGDLPANYQLAKLAPANTVISDNDFVTLAGFGVTNGTTHASPTGLMKVDVTVTQAHYSQSELLLGDADGKGACHGDSGRTRIFSSRSGTVLDRPHEPG